jgi:hypothetical protein
MTISIYHFFRYHMFRCLLVCLYCQITILPFRPAGEYAMGVQKMQHAKGFSGGSQNIMPVATPL